VSGCTIAAMVIASELGGENSGRPSEVPMLREVPIKDFVAELLKRIEDAKDINCCKDEIQTFCQYVVDKIGDDKIKINWKD
jgi:hypothetical protein